MDLDQLPEDQSKQELERAKQDAAEPIYVPSEWFTLAGQSAPSTTANGESPLHPFSASRRRAAGRLGFTASGSSIENAAGWVFLCVMPREEIDAARGKRWINGVYFDTESAFREKSEEWEDAIGLRLGGNQVAIRIGEIADELWLRETASAGTPIIPKGGRSAPGND